MAERPVLIGLGNELRGDDAAGLRVAELLRERGIAALRHDGEPIELLELLEAADRAVVIDAVAGAQPGRLWRLEAHAEPLPAPFGTRASTHLIGLADVIELGRSLRRLPARLEVIGIEGDNFALGAAPSTAVENASTDVAAALLAELREDRRPPAPAPVEAAR